MQCSTLRADLLVSVVIVVSLRGYLYIYRSCTVCCKHVRVDGASLNWLSAAVDNTPTHVIYTSGGRRNPHPRCCQIEGLLPL